MNLLIMKRLLTYLYRKYVLMPELRKLGIEDQYKRIQYGIVELVDDTAMLEDVLEYSENYHEGNRTIQ